MSNIVQNTRIRKLKLTVFILLGLYVMIGISLYFIQEKLLFHPTVLSKDYKYDFSKPFDEIFLKAEDGALINAVHFKIEKPKGVILYFHGNAGDLSRWGSIAEFFVEQNYDVFIMDYRTYGKSTGTLSEQVLYSDAQMCYTYLVKQYEEKEITVYGRSLGTGIATYIASKYNPKQLILETPYYSLVDVAKDHFPIFAVKYLMKYQLPTYRFVKNVKCQITIFHGNDDGVVPFKSGQKLFESLPKEQATFIEIEGGNHNNLIDFDAYNIGIRKVFK